MPRFCPECNQHYPLQVAVCPRDGTRLYRLSSALDLVGQFVDGRYEIQELLGEGGMGTVYRARVASSGREVALKMLRQDLAHQEEAVRRFFREARAASRLRSTHAVGVHDFGQTADGLFFLAMDLLKGRPLTAHLAGGPLDPARALRIADAVLEVLEEAHGAGIIHRDLKPDNLFLLDDPPDHVIVLDFGLAKITSGEPEVASTAAGATHGTPAYMSPEQAHGRALDGRSDLYSLGLVLFEMLTGRLAFQGDSTLDLMMQRTQRPAPRLGDLAPNPLPRGLEDAVALMLATDPADRISSAKQARVRLRDAMMLVPPVVEPLPAAGPQPPRPGQPGTTSSGGPDADRLRDAIATALALEEHGARLYLAAMTRATCGPARQVFHALMEEELLHVETFRALQAGLEAGGWVEPPRAPAAVLADRFAGLSAEDARAVLEDEDLPEALDQAIAFERRVVEFWEGVRAAARSPREWRFADSVVDEELGHLAALVEIRSVVTTLLAARAQEPPFANP